MSEQQIRSAVFRILGRIAPEANLDQISLEANLREALDIDSFDFLNLMIGLHDELNVEISESEYPKLSTLRELVRYLADRLE